MRTLHPDPNTSPRRGQLLCLSWASALRAAWALLALGALLSQWTGCRLGDDPLPLSTTPADPRESDVVLDEGAHHDSGDAEGPDDASPSDSADPEPHDATEGETPPPAHEGCMLVLVSDLVQAGAVARIDPATYRADSALASTWQDATLRVLKGEVYVLNRLGADNLQALDPTDRLRTLWQRSLGPRSNPWDLVRVGEREGVVALYGRGALRRVTLGGALPAAEDPLGDVSLAAFDPVDGNPEPAQLWRAEGRIYVLLQRLVRFACRAEQGGAVLALDEATLSPLTSWGQSGLAKLPFCNPTGMVPLGDGRLLVGAAGNYRVRGGESDDGGLVIIDLDTGAVTSPLYREAQLGGGEGGRDIVRMAPGEEGRTWLVLADESFLVEVRALTRQSGDVWTLSEPYWRAEGVFGVTEAFGRLWVADTTPGQRGVLVFDPRVPGAPPIAGPIGVGGPPVEVVAHPQPCDIGTR